MGVAFKGADWYYMQHTCCVSKYGPLPGCGGINPWQSTPKRPTTRRAPIVSKNRSCSEPPARAYGAPSRTRQSRSEEHTSELQSHSDLVCRLLLEKKKKKKKQK